MRTKTATRGNFYSYAIRHDGGRRYADQVGWQVRTLPAAAAAVDARGGEGYVQHWSDREQKRRVVAKRDQAGQWWAIDPFRGRLTPISPAGSECTA